MEDEPIDDSEEVVQINEIVPIHVGLHLILSYARLGELDNLVKTERREEHISVLEHRTRRS